MLSHDLARALLERRNNDVVIQVWIAQEGDSQPQKCWVQLQDEDDALPSTLSQEPVVQYDPRLDAVVIAAGAIVV